jgi:hypothetical protein
VTNEYHSVDGAEGEFLWSSSPQNVDLLPQCLNLCLKHYPRPDQIDNHPTNEAAKIPHCARSSSDSRSTAKQDNVCDRDKCRLTFISFGRHRDILFLVAAAISHANVSIDRSSAWACFELRRRSPYGAQRLTKRFQRFEQPRGNVLA